MSDEVREAAERLVRFHDEYDHTYWDGNKSPHDPDEDGVTVARAYLAAHKPDDGEPVTEDWLRRMGFQIEHIGAQACIQCAPFWHPEWPDDKTYTEVRIDDEDVFIHQGPDASIHWPVKIKTRGELRRLTAALGITIKD